MPFVQSPISIDKDPHQIHLVQPNHRVRIARFSTEVNATSNISPFLQARDRLPCPLFSAEMLKSTSVQPVKGFLIPNAFPVSQENQHVGGRVRLVLH